MKTLNLFDQFRRRTTSPAPQSDPVSTSGKTSAQAKSWLMPNPFRRAAKNQLLVGPEGAPQRAQVERTRAQPLLPTPSQFAQPINGSMNRAALDNINRRLGHLELAINELKLPDNHRVVGERVATSRNLPASFVTRAANLGVQLPLDTKYSLQEKLNMHTSINKLEARLEINGVLAPPVDYPSMSMADLDKVMPDLSKIYMRPIQNESSKLQEIDDELLRNEFDDPLSDSNSADSSTVSEKSDEALALKLQMTEIHNALESQFAVGTDSDEALAMKLQMTEILNALESQLSADADSDEALAMKMQINEFRNALK